MKRLVFALLGISALFANDVIEKGRPLNLNQISLGVSESSRFEVKESFSFGLNVHFNEYAASEDSMEIAFLSDLFLDPQGGVARFSSDFKPGMEVGFVLNTPYDYLNLNGDYLWFQSKTSVSKEGGPDFFYYSPIFHQANFDQLLNSIEANFKLNINVADLYLSRPYYSGKNLTFNPLMGLKAAFISQDFDLFGNVYNAGWDTQTVETKSISWGIGPKFGLQTNYLLGLGFSFFGDFSTSLLYTTYTKNDIEYEKSNGQKAFASNNNAHLVQPVIDSGIGLSFGSYAFNKSFHVNLTAAYNFSVFFSQNMSRALVAVVQATQAVPANLYLQGVSVGLAFVF